MIVPRPSVVNPALPTTGRRARSAACALCSLVVACAALAAGPIRAAERVAMMPLVAESLLPAARDELEQHVLLELQALGHEVQPMADTRAQIEEGMRTGLDCTLLEDDCAVRVGLVADVDVVVLTSVEVRDRALVLRAAWLEVQARDGRRITGAFSLPVVDGGASLRNLVALLVTGKGEPVPVPVELELDPPDASLFVDGRSSTAGTLWLLPGRHALRARAPRRVAAELTLEVSSAGVEGPVTLALPVEPREPPFPLGVAAGVGLGLTGGVVALGGGVAAWVIDAGLSEVMGFDERSARQSYGQAAVVVSSVATVLALGGVGLSFALMPTDEVMEQAGPEGAP